MGRALRGSPVPPQKQCQPWGQTRLPWASPSWGLGKPPRKARAQPLWAVHCCLPVLMVNKCVFFVCVSHILSQTLLCVHSSSAVVPPFTARTGLTPSSLMAAVAHCWLVFSLLGAMIPSGLSSRSAPQPSGCSSFPRARLLCLSLLIFMRFLSSRSSSQSKSWSGSPALELTD